MPASLLIAPAEPIFNTWSATLLIPSSAPRWKTRPLEIPETWARNSSSPAVEPGSAMECIGHPLPWNRLSTGLILSPRFP